MLNQKIKSIFKLRRIIKFILIMLVVFLVNAGYHSVSNALAENYQNNNSTINKILPPLLTKQKKLASQLTSAKHEKIITNYHYKQVFNKKNSKDKTLRKWINKKQKNEDKISTLKAAISANDKKVNHYQNAYISKANVHNATFNLTSIAIIIVAVIIFFIISF